MRILHILGFLFLMCSCEDQQSEAPITTIATGQMPNVSTDNSGNIHLVYGNGDSILYSYSTNKGQSFSSPALVSILPKLSASHTRGPQIATTESGLVVTACNEPGDIFSFTKDNSGKWSQSERVNDRDTIAKENLMALSSDGNLTYAVWLDLRDRHNKIFGSRSSDGGKTWSDNIMIYASPDTTVCECCKPSVVVKGNNVYVMFRNWLKGNRDLYLTSSFDGGNSFNPAQKLGNESWKLNGCPMDGGGLIVDGKAEVETVWNRKGSIYSCVPGQPEHKLGEGKHCTIESAGGKNMYAWEEDGKVIILKPTASKVTIGPGQLPVLKALNNDQVFCVWEHEKQIKMALLSNK